jgi:hypothetical protein
VVRASADNGTRVSNVVFMGMGEPLANYGAVLGALRRMTDPAPDGLGISARHITVSTVGLVPAIQRLSTEGCRSRSRSASTRRTTGCATRSSRSTPGTRSASCSTPPARTSRPPGGG